MTVRWDEPRLRTVPMRSSDGTFVTVILAIVLGFSIGALALMSDPATVGGTAVPGDLACEEDEVITFTAADELGCVHYQEVLP